MSSKKPIQLTLNDIVNFWVAGALSLTRVKSEAQRMLSSGYDSDAIICLAIDDECDVDELLELVAQDQNIAYPSRSSALQFLSYHYMRQILSKEISPYEGARKIFTNVICETDEPIESLSGFEFLLSEHDDFSDNAHIEYYGKEKCDMEIKRIEISIVTLSKKLLNNSAKIQDKRNT